jgi:hypothetical protein
VVGAGRGFAGDQRRGVEDQIDSPVGRGRDPLADRNPCAEFLAALANQRGGLGLIGLHLAAGELPATDELDRPGSPSGQHPPVPDEGRRHDRNAMLLGHEPMMAPVPRLGR